MSLVRVAGFSAIWLRLDIPQRGAWSALAELDTGEDAAPTGAVSIAFEDTAKSTFLGVIVSPSAGNVPTPGRSRVYIRGGAGGMVLTLAGKPYADVAPRLVVEDIVGAAAERLGAVASLGGLPTRRLWLRPLGSAGAALTRFLAPAGLLWRTSTAGLIDIVAETWPAYTGETFVEREPDETGRCLLALDAPDLLPGRTILSRHVVRVVHTVASDGRFRTEAHLE